MAVKQVMQVAVFSTQEESAINQFLSRIKLEDIVKLELRDDYTFVTYKKAVA